MNRETMIWLTLSGLALGWTGTILAAGGGLFVPLLVTALALACTGHATTRRLVTDKMSALFGAGLLRATAVTLLGVLMIQYLPLEIALFAAGDIIAYIELMAGIAFIATRMRIATAVRVTRTWLVQTPVGLIRYAKRAVRSRPQRRTTPKRSDDPDGWAFA